VAIVVHRGVGQIILVAKFIEERILGSLKYSELYRIEKI
jgi:hypothetical protein